MSQSQVSPVFEFLTNKENFPAVLEIVSHAEEIREYVAIRFWNKLQDSIMKHPKALPTGFSWKRNFSGELDGCFNLIARLPEASDKYQGLSYSIEAHQDYFGMGLTWNEKTNEFDRLCQLQPIKALQAELRKRSGFETDAPDKCWLWFERWLQNPYIKNPWSWFGEDRDDVWFNDKAEKFWDIVLKTHALVLEANKTPRRR